MFNRGKLLPQSCLFVNSDLAKSKVDEANRAMISEVELERTHHQKLVKDYARLQQRFENLQGEMHLLSPTGLPVHIHKRSASNISNISLESESSASTEKGEALREVKAENGTDEVSNGFVC